MKRIFKLAIGLFLVTSLFNYGKLWAHEHGDHSDSKLTTPTAFVENKGQWDNQAKYRINIPGGSMFLTNSGFMYNFLSAEDQVKVHSASEEERKNMSIRGHAYRVNFLNPNSASTFKPEDKRPEYSNYFLGADQSKWAGNVAHYNTVTQENLYEGVDLKVYCAQERNIKYDLIVKPGTNPDQIKFTFDGVSPRLLANGTLQIKTSVNEVTEDAPYTYQVIEGKKVTVPSRYKLVKDVVSFEFPEGYNKHYALIIDPNLIFASYSGGTSTSYYAHSATYDAAGNAYIAAVATGSSTGWPVTTGAYQTAASGSYAVTISKLNPAGSALIYATYFGPTSTGTAHPNTLRVSPNNELVMAGTVTTGAQIPTTTGAFQATSGGGDDLYIVKFNQAGSGLVACTYLGGSGNEGARVGTTTAYGTTYGIASNAMNPSEISFDGQGNIWITSNSASTNYPVTANAYQNTLSGGYDAVLTKLNPGLTSVLYSSYFGGSAWDGGIGMEFNNNTNEVVVTGYTASQNFPTTAGVLSSANAGGIDAFVLKVNNLNYQLTASTYMGTSASDVGMRVAFDCGNNVYIAGTTLGSFPVSNTAADGLVANGNIFLAKLSPALTNIVASTRTGANNTSISRILPQAMMVDNCGNILISSLAENMAQNNMPLTADAFQTNARAFYFAAFGPNFSSLEFGSYYGSPSPTSEHFHPGVCRMDPKGIVYVVVCTSIQTYPTTAGSFSPLKQNGSNLDIISFKFDFEAIGLDAASQSGYAGYGSIPHAVRGCKSAFINYTRNGDTTVPMILRFNIINTGANIAINGTDYQQIADSLYFAPYERTKSLEIKPLLVANMPTGQKMAIIESLNPCGCDGAIGTPIRRDTVYILDSIRAGISTPLPAYCPGTQITITGQVDPGLEFSWHPAEFNNNNLVITPTLLTTRDYTLTVTQPGAPATCPAVKKVFHAYVEQYPIIHMPSDTTVCLNDRDSVAIPVTVSPDSVNYLFNWSPATGLRAANLQTNFFKMPPGSYNYAITATTPLANCSTTHNMTINVRPPFELTNVLPASGTVVDYLDEVDMSAQGAVLYTWLPVHKFYDPTLQYATTMPVEEPGTYYVTGVDKYGCRDTVPITLDVRFPYDPVIPNAFTPNGDGKNDFFLIPNGKFQKLHRFEVYNRWGKKVFHTSDPAKGWDGTDIDNSKPCDQGVYTYIITVQLPNKEIKTYKGDVTLIR